MTNAGDGLRITHLVTIPLSEIGFRTSRSRGPGGQNVNKVESKVELTFDVAASPSLSEIQRSRVLIALSRKIDAAGVLHLTSQESRSQWENKHKVLAEFGKLMFFALKPPKKRIPTRRSETANKKRLEVKRTISEKKRSRKKPVDVEV